MTKRQNGGKKNHIQAQHYREFVANIDCSLEGTTTSTNSMLIGTADTNVDTDSINEHEEVKKKPLKYSIIDWVKRNILAEIIVAVVLAVGSITISHMIKIAVIEKRIEYVEEQIEKLDNTSVSKEYMISQLELIKSAITGETNLSINDIDWRLKNLEDSVQHDK